MGIWQKLEKKYFELRYKIVHINDFKKLFKGELLVCGSSLDSKVLDFLNMLDVTSIKQITIVTTYSNIIKEFDDSITALIRDIDGLNIKLVLKVINENIRIPYEIYFMSNSELCMLPREFFEESDLNVYDVNKSSKLRSVLVNASENSKDITFDRGNKVYLQKFDRIFHVSKRNIPDADKEKMLNAILSWETSGYDDIEPVLRIIEQKMRKLISIRLSIAGKNWFTQNVLSNLSSEIVQGIRDRFNKNKAMFSIVNIDDHPFPLEYLVMENYTEIINKNHTFFKDYRKKDYKKYHYYFDDIVKARNPNIHNRTPNPGTDFHSDTISKSLMFLEWIYKIEPAIIK